MTPIFGVDESQDVKTFYHNVAYKANRMAINVEKMKVTVHPSGLMRAAIQFAGHLTLLLLLLQILKERLGDCVRTEGVNYIEKCEQVLINVAQQASVSHCIRQPTCSPYVRSNCSSRSVASGPLMPLPAFTDFDACALC
jgi:hypothetical protein